MKPKPILLGTTLAALAAMNAPATAETYEYEDLTVTESVSYSDADFTVTESTVVSDVDGDDTVTLSFDNSEVSLNDLTINYNNADTGISLTDSSLNVSGTTTLGGNGVNDGLTSLISLNNSSVTLADVTIYSGFLSIADEDWESGGDSVSSIVITGTLYVGDEETAASAYIGSYLSSVSPRWVSLSASTITLADVVYAGTLGITLDCDTLTLTGSFTNELSSYYIYCDQLVIVISADTYDASDYAISGRFLESYSFSGSDEVYYQIEQIVISVSEEYLAEIVAGAATEYNFQIFDETAWEEINLNEGNDYDYVKYHIVLDDSWYIDGYEAVLADGVVTLTAVPEPGAFGILAGIAALAVVAVRRVHRSRKAA